MNDDNDQKMMHAAEAVMETQVAQQGVGCLRVSNGQVFLFSVAFLENLLAKARAAPEQRTHLFVAAGPDALKSMV